MNNEAGRERRVWWYCIGLLLTGVAVAAYASAVSTAPVGQPFQIPWPVFAVAFVLTEALYVDLEVKKEAQTLTFTEAPLTLGLLLAAPTQIIVVRIVAAAAAVLVLKRPPFIKLVFNTGQFALQIGLAMLAYHAVLGTQSAIEPVGWLAALVASTTAFAVSAVSVTVVMALAGAPTSPRSQAIVIGTGLAAALAGTATALGAAATLWRDGRSWVLLVMIGGMLGYFFVSFVRIRDRHQSLAMLHEFTTNLATARTVESLGEEIVTGIATLLQRLPRGGPRLFRRGNRVHRVRRRRRSR